MTGFVYILTNESYPELVKVGETSGDPEDRAAQLSNTSVPYPFKVYGFVQVDDPRGVERKVHRKLGKHRESRNREFFKISPDKVLKILEEISGEQDYRRKQKAKIERENQREKQDKRKQQERNQAFIAACKAKNIKEIKKLIKAGADIMAPCELAPNKKHYICNDIDIQRIGKSSIGSGNALHHAASEGHIEIVKLLIANGAEKQSRARFEHKNYYWGSTTFSFSAIELAVMHGHKDIVKLILTQLGGRWIVNVSHEAVHYAAYFGHPEILEMLIAGIRKSENEYYSNECRHECMKDSYRSYARDSLERHISWPATEFSPKHINNGANLLGGDTPLHIAVGQGHIEIVKLLIANGAKINNSNRRGKTPLNVAIEKKHKEIMVILRKNGGKKGKGVLGRFISEINYMIDPTVNTWE
jgi:hypothetical protein